eukprot:snap_masked-scaffold_5-processed-gene-9.16-mRNA-1 protein AED:1.00 eAED:1.00 QI:0/0/0/0/1/1/2/0/70
MKNGYAMMQILVTYCLYEVPLAKIKLTRVDLEDSIEVLGFGVNSGECLNVELELQKPMWFRFDFSQCWSN